jgi:hypothetical protein
MKLYKQTCSLASVLFLYYAPPTLSAQTTCTSYGYIKTGSGGLAHYLYVAAPTDASIIRTSMEARYADTDLQKHPWSPCVLGKNGNACCPTHDPNNPHCVVGAFYNDFQDYDDPEVAKAYVYTAFNVSAQIVEEFRVGVTYSWNKTTCRAMAWDRLQHNTGKSYQLMVDPSPQLEQARVGGRRGNTGDPWDLDQSKCYPSGDCNPPGQLPFNSAKRVNDVAGSLTGYQFGVVNNSGSDVRDVLMWFDFTPPPRVLMPQKKK